MKCKYCQTELESNSSVCPKCGKDNLKDDLKGLKIAALSLVCVVMLVLLAGIVHYGVTGQILPDWLSGTEPTTGGEKNTVSIMTQEGSKEIHKDDLAAYMDDVVVTMGEHTMTNADLQIYYWMVAHNEEGLDQKKPLTEQVYDKETGKTYHEYCLETGIDMWREMTLMMAAGKKAGFELDAETKAYLDGVKAELESYVQMYQYYGYDIKTVDELIQSMYGPASNFETYYNYIYATCYSGMYWSDMMEDFEVTDDQIQDYFNKNEESLKKDYEVPITKETGNLVDVRNIMISVITKKDESGATVEDWEATQAAAQAVMDEWLASDKSEAAFIELVKKHSKDENAKKNEGLYEGILAGTLTEVDIRHILIMPEDDKKEESWTEAEKEAQRILDLWLQDPTEENFGKLANEHSQDKNGKVTDGGIYKDVYKGQMVKAFDEWCFGQRNTGDYGIVKTEYGYHVMYFIRADRAVDNWVCDEVRQEGDVEMVLGDKGYHILYFIGSEPAWYRYSRYGAQSVVAEELLNKMLEENAFTVHKEAAVVAY